jgi:hypothetical protein
MRKKTYLFHPVGNYPNAKSKLEQTFKSQNIVGVWHTTTIGIAPNPDMPGRTEPTTTKAVTFTIGRDPTPLTAIKNGMELFLPTIRCLRRAPRNKTWL